MTTEAPSKPVASVPSFETIPETQMSKAKSYNSVPKPVQAMRDAFDAALKSLKPGEAKRVPYSSDTQAKSIRMNLRHACERTGIKIDAVVSEKTVDFKLAKA